MKEQFSIKDFPVFPLSTEALHQLLVITSKNIAEKPGASVHSVRGEEYFPRIILCLILVCFGEIKKQNVHVRG